MKWKGDYTTVAAARLSTEPEIRLFLNLPKPIKQLEEAFALPNLVYLELDISKGFGDIPASLKLAAKLKSVVIVNGEKYNGDLPLPSLFLNLPQIEILTVEASPNLVFGNESWAGLANLSQFTASRSGDRFPIGIVKAPKLEALKLNSSGIQDIPDEIGELKLLKKLGLFVRDASPDQVSKAITTLPLLEDLTLQIASIPDWIADFKPGLKSLELSLKGKFQRPDTRIFLNKTLESLKLWSAEYEEIGSEIGELTQLKSLNLWRSHFTQLPDEFGNLVRLEKLDLGHNKFKHLPGVLAKLPNLSQVNLKHQPIQDSEISNFEKFLDWLRSKGYDQHARNLFADVWDNREIALDRIDILLLAEALSSGIGTLSQNALFYLVHKSAMAFQPFRTGDKLLLGTAVGASKTTLKDKLSRAGVTLQVELEDSTTHCVISEKTPLHVLQQILNRSAFSLLSEAQLMDQINEIQPGYLIVDSQKESDSTLVERVNLFLCSLNTANIRIAFELLKGGGVPSECKTALFVVHKLADQPEDRQKAGKLLHPIASEKLKAALANRVTFISDKKHYDFPRKVAAFEQTEIDIPVFAVAHFRKYRDRIVTPFVFLANVPKNNRELLQLMVQNGQLKLYLSYYEVGFVPKEVLEVVGLKQLTIFGGASSLAYWQEFPVGIEKLQDLEILELCYDEMSIGHLPPTFLNGLAKLPKLRKFSLKAADGVSFLPLLQQQLPNCEFNFAFN